MKSIIAILGITAFVFFTGQVHAQRVPDKTLEGYVVGVTQMPGVKKGDTLKGFITVYNPLARQQKAVYYQDMSNIRTKKVWEPTRAKGYSTDGKFYEAIPYPASSDNQPNVFAEQVKRGKICLYIWYSINPRAEKKNERKPEETYEDKELLKDVLLRKANGEVVNINTFHFSNFKKAMSEFVKEDKELSARVAKGELGRDKVEDIVDEYNTWAGSKKHK